MKFLRYNYSMSNDPPCNTQNQNKNMQIILTHRLLTKILTRQKMRPVLSNSESFSSFFCKISPNHQTIHPNALRPARNQPQVYLARLSRNLHLLLKNREALDAL